MNNFLEELKQYFKNTPIEKVKEDWNKSQEWDNIGMKVSEINFDLLIELEQRLDNALSKETEQSLKKYLYNIREDTEG